MEELMEEFMEKQTENVIQFDLKREPESEETFFRSNDTSRSMVERVPYYRRFDTISGL